MSEEKESLLPDNAHYLPEGTDPDRSPSRAISQGFLSNEGQYSSLRLKGLVILLLSIYLIAIHVLCFVLSLFLLVKTGPASTITNHTILGL